MKTSPSKLPLLSVIILNYNSQDYLAKCLASLKLSTYTRFNTIVVDNASTDNSLELSKTYTPSHTKYLTLASNLGFAAGNNQGLQILDPQTEYVLFLNADTTVEKDTLKKMIEFFQDHPQVDASTCQIILAKSGQTQLECHRGFPTPWRSFCHFSGLGTLFPHSPLLNGYFLGHLDYSRPQKIEACSGAFLMIKKTVGENIKWWCEDYYFYGEDLDLCFQLQKGNYQLWYNPNTFITHYQGISSGIKKQTAGLTTASRQTKLKIAQASTQAMRIFYRRNLNQQYNPFTRSMVNLGINLLEIFRTAKAQLTP
ncbi:glycosyltransferase family 2 protein [Patescibacteria group bacterium]|nr:glycosyltransferase family 2 protein [Patescibacteria group bacterium]